MTEHPILFKGWSIRANMNCVPGQWPAEPIDPSLPFKFQTRRAIGHAGNSIHEGKLLGEWALSEPPQQWNGNTTFWRWQGKHKARKGDWFWKLQTEVDDHAEFPIRCPYGISGDGIWSRETWAVEKFLDELPPSDMTNTEDILPWYRADPGSLVRGSGGPIGKWRPSIFLPRWACREVPEVKRIRVERVQDISGEDAIAEGWQWQTELSPTMNQQSKALLWFQQTWENINKARGFGWEKNPWVWVVDYMRTAKGI